MSGDTLSWLAIPLALLYLGAIACIYRILLTYRTPQGAIAWIIALLGLPYLAVPAFLLFGRIRFGGYVKARRMGNKDLSDLLDTFENQSTSIAKPGDRHFSDELQIGRASCRERVESAVVG